MRDAGAVGKLDPIGAGGGLLERGGLSLAGSDRGEPKPDALLDDHARLAARLAEAAGAGDAGERR